MAKPAAPRTTPTWGIPERVPPKVGTLTLARFPNSTYWWPALVQEVRGNLVTVQYGGGASQSLPPT